MILSDRDIKKRIIAGSVVIRSPFANYLSQVHASSMDCRLGKQFKLYEHSQLSIIDPMDKDGLVKMMRLIEVEDGKPFIIQPGEFVLGVTMEEIKVPDDLVVRVEGRSSLGRIGLIVHATAGFVDPGFEGSITLEMSNINRLPIAIYPGMRICQLAFETMTSSAEVPYGKKRGAKYQGQRLPEESRLSQDEEFQLEYQIYQAEQKGQKKLV